MPKVLDIFDWHEEDDSCFRCGIAESLFREGKITESYDYYEQWLSEDPNTINGINSYSWMLFEHGEYEKAYERVRKVTWGVSCSVDNSILFMRAKQLANFCTEIRQPLFWPIIRLFTANLLLVILS